MGSPGRAAEWSWAFSPRPDDQFAALDPETHQRIVSKLDAVVSSEWREPSQFLEPLSGSPFEELRAGDYRLGCRLIEGDRLLYVESIRTREGAYSGDD